MVIVYEATESNGQLFLSSSNGKASTDDFDSLINLLLDGGEADRFFWDLDTGLTPILRQLPPDKAEELWHTRRCKIIRGSIKYDIFFIPSKVFSIERKVQGKETRANLYFLGQFFPDELDNPHTLTQCVEKAEYLIRRLGEKGFITHRFTSPIAIFSEELETLHLPRVHRDKATKRSINDTGVPNRALLFATMCGGRLWTEAFQLGLHQHVYHWDLRSAFSRAASQLQDTRETTWIASKDIPKEACMGVCRATVTINPDVKVSPIILQREGKVAISPVGTFDGYFMLPDLRFIQKWGIGKVEVLEGYWGVPTRIKRPLAFIYSKVVKWREEGEWESSLYKRFLNGIYGKMLERHDDGNLGDFWNSMWGATINSEIACKVANCIYEHNCQDKLTQVGVDSFSVTEPIDMSKEPDWQLIHEGPQLVVSSGIILESNKQPQGWTLEQLLCEIKSKPEQYRYTQMSQRRLTLGDAVQKNAYDKIGSIIDVEATVDLSIAHDRIFNKCPRIGGELLARTYPSIPIHVGEVSK